MSTGSHIPAKAPSPARKVIVAGLIGTSPEPYDFGLRADPANQPTGAR
jgi:hypothetical protein